MLENFAGHFLSEENASPDIHSLFVSCGLTEAMLDMDHKQRICHLLPHWA